MSKHNRSKKSNQPQPQGEPLVTNENTTNEQGKLPEENPSVVIENTKPVTQTDFSTYVNNIKTNGTVAEKNLIQSLENYMNLMAPGKPLDHDTGARHQFNLWKIISNVAEHSVATDFKKLWTIILVFFNEYKQGVFHERYVFRFSENWVWSDQELNGFQRIINIIKLTADPTERAIGLKQVSLDRSLSEGFTDEARQRIVGYYH